MGNGIHVPHLFAPLPAIWLIRQRSGSTSTSSCGTLKVNISPVRVPAFLALGGPYIALTIDNWGVVDFPADKDGQAAEYDKRNGENKQLLEKVVGWIAKRLINRCRNFRRNSLEGVMSRANLKLSAGL
jgi:hypothetical protein